MANLTIVRTGIAALAVLVAAGGVLAADSGSKSAQRRVDVHLYTGDTSAGAPLAPWYHGIGITDVWLYPVRGAFPQDQRPETQKGADDLAREGTLAAYRKSSIRYWWFERPVPDFFYVTARQERSPGAHLWDSRPETDERWAAVCRKIAEIYPTVRRAGFAGIVFDTEAYYSFSGDASGQKRPWVWAGYEKEYGKSGNYYRRGLQVGRAIQAAWPGARVIIAYAFGYQGERWWYQGIQDGGATVLIGPEHTYGAGPGDLGHEWYQSWWGGKRTKETCDLKRTQFPFLASNQQVVAGLFPIDFGAKKPNYRARDFRQQLLSAATEDAAPIAVWLWPQGPFTPKSWQSVRYAEGESAASYLAALREFSSAFAARQAP